MIHTIRTVAVGDRESKIDSPIILYRGDREVEVEFTINGSKFTFTNGGNVIKSTNATHGQMVINTPTGENTFSEVTECHDGKVVFVIAKEMIDELVEVGFYSFQIRLFDESQVSRVTIPPVLKGIDIRNPIAAEDETDIVDIGLVDYSVVVKDEFEDLSTFLPDGNYNKTEWESKDIISGAKLNKIEDALYNINSNMEATDLALLNRVENINKTIHSEIDKLVNELESEAEEFERDLNKSFGEFKIDVNNSLDVVIEHISDVVIENISDVNDKLGDKMDLNAILTMANMGQDVKEAMTGGSVAVVDTGCILEENVITKQITPQLISFIKTKGLNQFDKSRAVYGFLNNKGGVNQSDDYMTTHYIPVVEGIYVTISRNTRIYNLYDATYKLLDDGFHDPKALTSEATTFIVERSGFLRCTFAKGALDTYQVSFTESLQPYERYEIEADLHVKVGVDDLSCIERKVMCFNKDSSENSIGFIGTDGNITSGTSGNTYTTTHYIQVNKNDYVYINTSRKIALYHQDKSFYTMLNDSNISDYSFQSPLNGYIKISFNTSRINDLVVGIQSTPFIPPYPTINDIGGYGWQLVEDIKPHTGSVGLEELNDDVKSKLSWYTVLNKVLLNLGDSIAAGDGNDYRSYAHIISEKFGWTLHSYAKGGATIGTRSTVTGYLNILNQVESAISDNINPDFIFLNGGTNDINNNAVDLGTMLGNGVYDISGCDSSTFCGALELIFYKLRTAYPSAKIIFIRVHKMNTRNIDKQIEYGDKAQQICDKWSIPVVDIFNGGGLNTFLPCMYQYTNPTTTAPNGDRTHPNQEGYERFYVPLIEQICLINNR